ncbi:hypothetical protein BRM1_06370 [Brevibacterium sp. BRM-1]|uniref:hypothetical protein n=1 Tax=Brevibacterium sp. BRM-1 TaxID=2999062 RepID=UPI00228054AC|nr:hypothetical protein [Brevibacterium sp. BRM-1]WAL41461.1 hypothetical protein BRM1_06370 [Brevibacterium sp. BRM-1]
MGLRTISGRKLGALSLAVALGAGVPLAAGAIDGTSSVAHAEDRWTSGVAHLDGEPDVNKAPFQVKSQVEQGGKIVVKGTGWQTKDNTQGSVIAMKIDDGAVSRNKTAYPLTQPDGKVHGNATTWAITQADASGNWTIEAPIPTPANSDAKADDFAPGTKHSIRLLTGSLLTGDLPRTGTAEFTMKAAAPATTAAPTTSAPSTTSPAPAAATMTATNPEEGGKIHLEGKGFVNKEGTDGNTVAFKLDEGGNLRNFPITVNGTTYEVQEGEGGGPGNLKRPSVWGAVKAAKDGSFSVDLDVPTAANDQGGADSAWKAGTQHSVRALSGNIVPGDSAQTVGADVTVKAKETPAPVPEATVTASDAQEGGKLHLEGDHFLDKTGKAGAKDIVIKLDEGSVWRSFPLTVDGKTYEPKSDDKATPANDPARPSLWAVVSADDKGHFSADVDVPTEANNQKKIAWKAGEDDHTVTVLSGGLNTGDAANIVANVPFKTLPKAAETTSPAPTTVAPTTDAPTTAALTTDAPTTDAPTSAAPTDAPDLNPKLSPNTGKPGDTVTIEGLDALAGQKIDVNFHSKPVMVADDAVVSAKGTVQVKAPEDAEAGQHTFIVTSADGSKTYAELPFAVQAEKKLEVTPDRITPADFVNQKKGVTLNVTGAKPGETVEYAVSTDNSVKGLKKSVKADDNGTATWKVFGTDASNPSAYLGLYKVVATADGEKLADSFRVTDTPNKGGSDDDGDNGNGGGNGDNGSGDDSNGGGNGSLPRTGAELGALGLGTALLVIGGATVFVTRRRMNG